MPYSHFLPHDAAFLRQLLVLHKIAHNDAVEKPFLQKYTQFFTAPISFHHTADIFDNYH
jgi:hypothetical protein